MSVLLVTGRGGDAAPDTANRDAARTRALARHIDHLVVLEADETWWNPIGARGSNVSSEPGSYDPSLDARRSSLGVVLADAAASEPGTVLLLLDADVQEVKRIHPLARRLRLPLLWWHEEAPSPGVLDEVSTSIAGLLTTWPGQPAVPGWRWNVGAGIDLEAVPVIEMFPARPPLRLLAWAPAYEAELDVLLQALALARGLTVDVHLTLALSKSSAEDGQRHHVEAQVRNLALTRCAHVTSAGGPESFAAMLAGAHALVDVEGPDRTLPLDALLAMAHGRPVLSSRDELAPLLEAAPLPLHFEPGDATQLADRMKPLAAAWSDELTDCGQSQREAVRAEHSLGHWAEAVASIVGFARTKSRAASEPDASESGADIVAVMGNSSSAPSLRSELPEPETPDDLPNQDGAAEATSDNGRGDATVGAPPRRRRRWRRAGNQ